MQPRSPEAGALALFAVVLVLLFGGCGCAHPATSTSASTESTASGGSLGSSTSVAQSGQQGSTTTSSLLTTISIGALFPLSGDLTAQGETCLSAMRLAADEVNAAGGIHSLGGARLEIVSADSKGDPENAEPGFNRLVSEGKVSAVVGAYQSAVAIPAGKAAQELKVPFIVSAGAANQITSEELKYTFRLCPKAEWYARDQVSFLLEPGALGDEVISKVALLHEDGEFGGQTAADQRALLAEAGVEVVKEIAYPADQADFNDEILDIKSSGAQAVLTATYLNDAALIAESAQTLRLNIPILDAGGGTTETEFLTRAGSAAQSIITELEYCPGTSATEFETNFTAAGGTVTAAAVYSYQAVWLLANALERGRSSNPEILRVALATSAMSPEDHMVLPQSLLSFNGEGQNRAARLFVVQIQDLKYVPVWPAEYAREPALLP